MGDKAKQREEIKKLIRSILVIYPSQLGVRCEDFLNDYKGLAGDLPYRKFGYNNVEDFLIDIPDVASISYEKGHLILRCVANESMQHVMELVNKQRVSTAQKKKRFRPRRTSYFNSSYGGQISQQYSGRDRVYNNTNTRPLIVPHVKPYLRSKIRELCFAHPSGLNLSDFDHAFACRFGLQINFHVYGFSSLLELFRSINDILELKESANGGYRVYARKGQLSDFEKKSNDSKPKSPNSSKIHQVSQELPVKLKDAIQKVLQSKPDGIWSTYFKDEFQKFTGKPLPQFGYESVVEMMGALPDIVNVERGSQKDWILKPVRQEASVVKATNQIGRAAGRGRGKLVDTNSPQPRKSRGINPVFKERIRQVLLKAGSSHMNHKETVQRGPLIPEDAVGPGCHYSSMPVQPSMEQYLEVYVSNVSGMDMFWLQLIGVHSTEALETLMDQLEETYCGYQGNMYSLPMSLVTIGQLCVAVYPEDNNWHRCTITGIRDNNFVEVFYVDYGSTQCVPKISLKFLKNCFLTLPAQAIPARLANLKLLKKSDGIVGQKKLLSMVEARALYAIIVEKDKDDHVSVCLCDTSVGEDVWINDLLCTEGFAEYVEMQLETENTTEQKHEKTEVPAEKIEVPTVKTEVPAEKTKTLEELVNQDLEGIEQSTSEEEQETYERFLRFTKLTDKYSVHIVNFNRMAWLVTAELSAFLWEKDLIRSQLRQKKMILPKEVLMKEDHPQIFEELKHYQVAGCVDGDVKNHITLYKLENAIEVLDAFKHPAEDLREAITKQIKQFNPDDPFWKGQEEDEDDEEEEDDSGSMSSMCNKLTVRELEIAQEALQMKRKQIFKQMNDDTSKIAEFVDQLDFAERQLVSIRRQLKFLAPDGETGRDISNSKMTETDHLTLQCMEEQYNSAKAAHKKQAPIKSSSLQQPNVLAPLLPSIETNMASLTTKAEMLPAIPPALPPQQQQMLLQYQQNLLSNNLAAQPYLPYGGAFFPPAPPSMVQPMVNAGMCMQTTYVVPNMPGYAMAPVAPPPQFNQQQAQPQPFVSEQFFTQSWRSRPP